MERHLNACRIAVSQAFKWRSIYRAGWVGSDEDSYRATLMEAETLWVDPESKDPINETQALTNLQTIGVPQPILWRKSGMSPQEIKEALKLRAVEDERAIKLAQAQQGAGGGQAPGAPAEAGSEASGAPSVAVQDTGDTLTVTGLPGPPTEASTNGAAPKPEEANA